MEITTLVMYVGFLLSAYSVVGNDVIQTLGTFLSSNEKRPWYILWAYAAVILTVVVCWGWYAYGGDVSYGRLSKIDLPTTLEWWYILPPLVLMLLTRFGFPVSTTFLILSVFSPGALGDMVIKSLLGYLVAFVASIGVYLSISRTIERHFIDTHFAGEDRRWMAAQWISTGFLWSQWLIQDMANIYVYLPRDLSFSQLCFSLVALLALLALIFYMRGGVIQRIVKSKTNTDDVRSATLIDFIYGFILLIFKEWSAIPMSTTWVFVGLLAGREFAIAWRLRERNINPVARLAGSDLAKVVTGLVVSVIMVFLIRFVGGNISLPSSTPEATRLETPAPAEASTAPNP
ncbi:hypothetical protein SAMN05421823_10898 [Catalinimonas alkaloidigena]|uniref:Phosphate/sulfate permease n=1 Tax=Catalinimonas alkaloidigena TaxID=1075417 RepID=A0A1G9MVW3_9BACT|nr:hypothetical protein [Catalinimonas alkaloidigena]SDL78161.1 hypothetical protein SAMN05421823_10898 [Catalinimonas alkaloidigena]